MPQMAPMNWVSLLVSTVIILLTLNTFIYFINEQTPLSSKKSKSLKINWKW